jgi:hypothetical protein
MIEGVIAVSINASSHSNVVFIKVNLGPVNLFISEVFAVLTSKWRWIPVAKILKSMLPGLPMG